MKKLLLFGFMMISLFGIAQTKTIDNKMFSLIEGETITIHNTKIKFLKVLEDSRCPKKTTCIWEGRAKILVKIESENGQKTTKEIIFGALRGSEKATTTLIQQEDYFIEAISLKPYPEVETKKENYVLWVCEGS